MVKKANPDAGHNLTTCKPKPFPILSKSESTSLILSAGVVKKATQTLKIMHDKYAKDVSIKEDFQEEFQEPAKHNRELKTHLNKVQDDLNPIRILGLFERIPDEVIVPEDSSVLKG